MSNCQYIRFFSLVLALMSGLAQAQDSAVLDARQNAWKLYYQDPETDQWIHKTYVQQNAINPRIKSTVQSEGTQYVYRYRVSNRRGAKQAVDAIRIWGIPLVYIVPSLPPVTADQRTNNEAWTHQYWAQLVFKGKFEDSVVQAPKGWSAGLRVDEDVKQTSFVWTPGLKDTDPNGIDPGTSQDGFTVIRQELPGVARAKLTGSTAEPWGLDNLPDTPFWQQKIDEIQDLDYVLVPVLAPVIPVPSPYNGAELARRLKAHAQTWLQHGHVSVDVLTRLNRQFDMLIPALEMNNKAAARAAVVAMRKELADRHPGLNDEKAGEEDDGHDAQTVLRTPAQRAAAPALTIDRVAARALAFDLRFLMQHMDVLR